MYDAITQAITKNIVTNSSTANNHLVFSLLEDSGNGNDGGGDNGNGDDDEQGDNDPSIDTFNVNARPTGPWLRAAVIWAVSDVDGDLNTLVVELLDGDYAVDSSTINVSGSNASGETDLRTRGSAGSVRLIVIDDNGII